MGLMDLGSKSEKVAVLQDSSACGPTEGKNLVMKTELLTMRVRDAPTTLFGRASWIARAQTDGISDSRQQSFRTEQEALAWWRVKCNTVHRPNGARCKPFKAVNFSLDPSPTAAPGPPPCTPRANGVSTAGQSSASASSVPPPVAGLSSVPPPVPGPSTAAPSPFKASSSGSPTPKKDETTSPSLFLPLLLVCNFHPQATFALRPSLALIPRLPRLLHHPAQCHPCMRSRPFPLPPPMATQVCAPMRRTPPHTLRSHPATVLVTPGPHMSPGPPAAPELPRVSLYGIRGVSIFYNLYAAAQAAVACLGLSDSRIMVSDNVEKLEAWTTNKLFARD
ncbi:hypothetical protein C8R43DRAFT_946871 [Mycena crocata]|nr:hypothetical protein C8R43DRAFT_946871 [Mycena crocata]